MWLAAGRRARARGQAGATMGDAVDEEDLEATLMRELDAMPSEVAVACGAAAARERLASVARAQHIRSRRALRACCRGAAGLTAKRVAADCSVGGLVFFIPCSGVR